MLTGKTLLCGAIYCTLTTAALSAESAPASIGVFVTGFSGAALDNGTQASAVLTSCNDFPNPGKPGEFIDSCMYSLDGGKLLIVNAERDGPISDVATQSWHGDIAAAAISWVATALDGTPDAGTAAKLAGEAASASMAEGLVGGVSFVVLKSGDGLTITAFP